MTFVQEPAKKIPVTHETDICVLGGSCTGVFAAVRAARLGWRVACVEQHGCFGGVATVACVNIWHSLRDTTGDQTIIGGLTQEVIDRLQKRGAVATSPNPVSAYRLNTEELKIELDELVRENGIVPFLHTRYAAPILKDGRLDAIIIENSSGRQAIRARQFIDATGDAALALQVDVPSWTPEGPQPPTLCAKIHGWSQLGDFNWVEAIREHGSEFGLRPDWGWGSPIPGVPDLQLRADTHVFDCETTDARQLTEGEMEGRRQIRAIMDLIRQYGPAEANITLVDIAARIGARESHRIKARYRLTADDLLYGRRFPDAIANGTYRVDIHHADGPGITFQYLDGTEKVIPERGVPAIEGRWRDPLPEDPCFYQIPWSCLLQERLPNLLCCGRMLDADRRAFSAARVMVNMNQTGEAAGVAAALAMQEKQAVQQLDPVIIRDLLADGGSIII